MARQECAFSAGKAAFRIRKTFGIRKKKSNVIKFLRKLTAGLLGRAGLHTLSAAIGGKSNAGKSVSSRKNPQKVSRKTNEPVPKTGRNAEKGRGRKSQLPSAQTEKRTEKKSAPSRAKEERKVPPVPELLPVPEAEGKVRMNSLPLAREILGAAQTLNFKYCTPIQAQCLPAALEGRDLAAKAQTGTGKTAAFLASSMTRLLQNPLPPEKRRRGACRVLVLSPTRELAIQIKNDADGLAQYTALHNLVVFGGMDHRGQREALEEPVDILVGTPGRIIDYSRSGDLYLGDAEILVIDEADRMLDMGFIPDVRRIVSRLPEAGKRQTMLFSATLEPEVLRLVKSWLVDPLFFEAEPEHVVTDLIEQKFYAVTSDQKLAFLLHLLKTLPYERIIIFGNWKEKNRILAEKLYEYGYEAGLLSGDIPQEKRLKLVESFKKGDIKILVATDVAARGLHVEGISHVINYDLPDHPEDYVHRIGRTGRAGNKGCAIGFVCEYGAYVMPEIEKYAHITIKTDLPEEEALVLPEKVNERRSLRERVPGGGFRRGNSGRSSGRPRRF